MSWLIGFLAKSVLMTSPFGAILKGIWNLLGKIPWQVWAVFFAAVALFLGVKWHGHEVHKTFASGYAKARAEDRAELDRLKAQVAVATANMARISQTERTKNDAANHDIHAAAASLSLQGPGAASCSRRLAPAIPVAAGGLVAANRPADPAPAPMPPENGSDPLAAVSWRWLVGTGGQCDIERTENISWRTAYAGWVAEWEKLRAAKTRP